MKKYIYIILFLPNILHAQVIFNELVYNPEGTDSGREWVEVYNNGSTDVDLSMYKILENEVNHKISGENTILKPGEYAVIADNIEKFLLDYPSYTGSILDSVFSLNNTGETIQIINPSAEVDDSIAYNPEWGANGTSNSLQNNDGIWIPAIPTPGKENTKEVVNENTVDNDNSSGGDTESTHEDPSDISDYEYNVGYGIDVGRDRYGVVNKPIEFEVYESSEEGSNKVYWSFGDGGSSKSKNPEHYYSFPGIYNVVVTSKRGEKQAVARTKVYIYSLNIVVEPLFSGKTVDILLKNSSSNEVNIGGFVVKTDIDSFKIPSNTIVDGNQTIMLSSRITRLDLEKKEISLFYPNGDRVEI